MSNIEIYLKHPLITLSYLSFIQFKYPPPPLGTPRQFGTIQMHIVHIVQSIGTNGRVQCMPRWRRNANGLYNIHMCIIHVSMQGWIHDGKHLHVWSCIFKLITRSCTSNQHHIRLQLLLSTNSPNIESWCDISTLLKYRVYELPKYVGNHGYFWGPLINIHATLISKAYF